MKFKNLKARNTAIILYFKSHYDNTGEAIAEKFGISKRISERVVEKWLSKKRNYMKPKKYK